MSRVQPRFLYTAAQSRAVDRCAINEHGLPGSRLMARAARAAFALLLEKMPQPAAIQVLCGPGNNGGDGLLLAMLARDRGIPTRVFLLDGEPRSPDAQAAATRARAAGLALEDFTAAALADEGVLIDAMLGTGINGEPRPAYRAAIDAVNALRAPVLALDIASGVDSDSGAVVACAVRADWTLSFITAKRGVYTGAGADHAGERYLDDLDVPAAAFSVAEAPCELLQLESLLAMLPARPRGAHKGHYGRCLLVGGDTGMGGAIMLATEAALRTGLGLARVATRPAHVAPLLCRVPEAMVSAVEHRNALLPLLDWADTVVLGPGLGREPWGEQMLHASFASGKPLLVDADALNMLATRDEQKLAPGSVITPHPGEAARLLKESAQQLQADRFSAATRLSAQTGAAVVLKGSGSLVTNAGQHALCMQGNPGMASGGMGDVLSGIIGGLLAQGLPAESAARLGTALHAHAGDRAAARCGQRAMLASDLLPDLAELLK